LELAAHHYPDRRIDLTYLTGPLSRPTPPTNGGQRYAHLTWGDILPLVSRWWTDSRDKGPAAYMDALSRVCRSLDVSWSAWRDDYVGTHVPGPRWPTSEEILAVVTATAQTRKQQAIDFAAQSLDSLHTLRLEARGLIQESPFGSPMRHVLPWVWSTASTGAALTAAGAENGRDFASRTTPSRNTRLEGAM
jgi:hypothetical protein